MISGLLFNFNPDMSTLYVMDADKSWDKISVSVHLSGSVLMCLPF